MKVVPLVTPLREGPALAGPAGTGRFLVEGERITVRGDRRDTIRSIWIAGREVVRGLGVEPGIAVNVVAYPGLLRRERVGPTGTTTETVVAAPTSPLVTVQLEAAAGLTLRFEIVGGVGAAPRVEGGRVRTMLDHDLELAAAVSPADAEVTVGERTPTGVVIEVRAKEPGPLTLAIATGPSARVDKTLAGAAFLAVSAHAAAQWRIEEGVALDTGVPELDEGIHWARMRLANAVTRAAAHGTESDVFLAGLAAAAVGDAQVARLAAQYTVARAHVKRASWDEAALLASRLAMVFGVTAPARRVAGARVGPAPGGSEGLDVLDPSVAEALADALRHAAPDALIDALRRVPVSPAEPERPAGGGGRRLPMAGRRGRRYVRLVGLLAGTAEGTTGAAGASPVAEAAAVDLAARLRADPDAGWARWRGVLSAGLDGGPEGAGSWDPAHALSGDAVGGATAGLLLALVHGVLGFAPDAPVGRARVAPALPSHLKALRVRGLPVGASTISLGYERSEGRHRFTLVPERGGVPPLLVFEPAVPGTVTEVLVDGARADLALRWGGGRTVVPIQLPLDGPRTVEIVPRS